MLRLIVIVLVISNFLYFGWTKGWFGSSQQEDIPLQQPVNPQAIQIPEAAEPSAVPEPAAPSKGAEKKEATKAGSQQESTQQETSKSPDSGNKQTPSAKPPAKTGDTAAGSDAAKQIAAETVSTAGAPSAAGSTDNANPRAVAQADPPAAKAGRCMAYGLFTEEEMNAIRPALARLPKDGWRSAESKVAGRWMVFHGRFDDDLVLAAKRAELERLKISFDTIRSGSNGQGFSLGRYSSEEAASNEMARLRARGLTDLKVIVERQQGLSYTIFFNDYDNLKSRFGSRLNEILADKSARNC